MYCEFVVVVEEGACFDLKRHNFVGRKEGREGGDAIISKKNDHPGFLAISNPLSTRDSRVGFCSAMNAISLLFTIPLPPPD